VRTSASDPRGVLLTVGIGEVLIQLGLVPVIAVMPALSTALGVGPAEGAWVLTVFILALAGSLLVFGRLGDLVGHRVVFGWGAAIYAAGGLAAGLAPGLPALLAARAVQGLGAAMVSGNNLAILASAMPIPRQGRAIAAVAAAASLVSVAGAAVATAAMERGGWPLLFLGPVPLAVWAAVRARRLPQPAWLGGRAPVDWAGAAMLMVAITVLAVALNHPHGSTSEAVMPVFHAGLPAVAVLAGLAFVMVERRVAVPLLDWSRLRERAFAAAIGVNTVLHLTMMAAMFLAPLLVVRGLGGSTAAGGAVMIVVQSSVVATAFLGGWLHDRTGAFWIRPAAAGVLVAGFAGWAMAGAAGSHVAVIAAGALAGAGTGALLAVNNAVIMKSLPDEYRGVASGMLETTRHFGHAFGVTIPTAIVALVAHASAGAGEAAALRWGFVWSCLVLAAIGLGGVVLARVRPRVVARDGQLRSLRSLTERAPR
jgi:MFS family permease